MSEPAGSRMSSEPREPCGTGERALEELAMELDAIGERRDRKSTIDDAIMNLQKGQRMRNLSL